MSLRNFIVGILVLFITFEGLVIVLYRSRLERYQVSIEALSEQVGMLETQADELSQRFKDAQNQADEEVQKSQKEVKEILVAKVPVDCDKAIKWAIDEAKVFSA